MIFSRGAVPLTVAFAAAAGAAPADKRQEAYTSASASFVAPPGPPPSDVPVTNVTSHGPFTGQPTTTGALSLSVHVVVFAVESKVKGFQSVVAVVFTFKYKGAAPVVGLFKAMVLPIVK